MTFASSCCVCHGLYGFNHVTLPGTIVYVTGYIVLTSLGSVLCVPCYSYVYDGLYKVYDVYKDATTVYIVISLCLVGFDNKNHDTLKCFCFLQCYCTMYLGLLIYKLLVDVFHGTKCLY